MGIIQLEGYLLIEFMNIIMLTHIFGNCLLYGSGDKEILLFQTQLLTCIMVIIRIKNLNNVSCKVFLLNGLLIIPLVKGV